MNKPKDIPSLPASLIPQSVSAGLQRLPGASRLVRPSIAIHAMIRMVDRMPRIDVYDRRDSGMNIVGMMLQKPLAMNSREHVQHDVYSHQEAKDFVLI